MADLAQEFADWLAAEGRAANTVAAYRRDVAAYLKWRSTTEGELGDYVEHVRSTRARSSADRAVVALRIFHRWRDDATPTPELIGLPRPAPTNDEPLLSEDDVARLLRAAEGETAERRRDAVTVALLYFGGLKATEAISLDVADVAADAMVLTVDRDGPHERLLPVVPALRAVLVRWLDGRGRTRLRPSTSAVLLNRRGQRLTRQGLWLLTSAVGRRAALLDALSPNDLRRACGAHLGDRGVPATSVGAFLGHSRGPMPTSRMLNEIGWGSCNLSL
ncbi:MAG TPA: tyrosine-type recombinase/integrase [Acidimicrobiales bacterium]|nr:tyrosine-type recombinase/integrase [Acidimicrobiales bacterium]